MTAPTPEEAAIRYKPDGVTLVHGELQRLAFLFFEDAYDAASAGGTVPADARQLGYALRRLTGLGDRLDIAYVTTSPANNSLLDKYIRAHPDAANWDVVRSPRGTFLQPNGDSVPLGTLAVRGHLRGIIRPVSITLPQEMNVGAPFPKFGPTDDFGSALYIEKAGFNALLNANGLPRRRDLALLSSQGFSVDAARLLLVRFVQDHDLGCYVAHDFDASGIGIAATIQREVDAVDLGLRWRDIEEFESAGLLDLMQERVTYTNDPSGTLRDHGATDDEIDFLCSGVDADGKVTGLRVELNALVGQDFIDWLDERLVENGIEKAIPTDAIIESAWRRAYAVQKLNEHLDEVWHEFIEAAEAHDLNVPQLLSELTIDLDVEGGTRETWRTFVEKHAEDTADEEDEDEPEVTE